MYVFIDKSGAPTSFINLAQTNKSIELMYWKSMTFYLKKKLLHHFNLKNLVVDNLL